MPTSAFGGFNGKVYVSVDGGANFHKIGETRDATISVTQNDIDATSFDSIGWMERVVGFKEWEMSTESLYVYDDFGQVDIEESIFGGEVVKWRFLPKVAVGNKGYEGDGFVSSYEVNIPVDDAVTLSMTISGSGYLSTYQAV